ncbi:MAG: TlpA disulfide reductase family protein [Pseudomonadota bacterium]
MTRVSPILLLAMAIGLGANAAHPQDLASLQTGYMRGVVFHDEPVAVSAQSFTDMEDGSHALADFEGQVVLLNFWATWCAPCREEMPSLDALQQELGGEDFQVVTLATGRNPPQAVRRFFEEEGIEALPTYLDPRQNLAREMTVFGLPITVIIDREGREIGRLRGDADWHSAEAVALLQAIIDG